MKISKAKILTISLLVFSFPVFADPKYVIPPNVIIGFVLVLITIGIIISYVVSYLFKRLFEKLLKERRKHIWFMRFSTFLFLAIYYLAEEKYNLLNPIEHHYNYETREFMYFLLLVILTILGFTMGYFLTPKKAK